jgi:hypothetical protein
MLEDFFPTSTAMMLLEIVLVTLVMFLPALVELRRPKDAGPRRISEDFGQPFPQKLASMERTEQYKIDKALAKKILEIISVLPNLEG